LPAEIPAGLLIPADVAYSAGMASPTKSSRRRRNASIVREKLGGNGLGKMARKGAVKYLQKAKSGKNDEFYTILSNIEKSCGTTPSTSRTRPCKKKFQLDEMEGDHIKP
jgi:hypothetical protein